MRFEVRFELTIECLLSVAVVAWSQRYCLYLVSVMELLGIDVDHKIEVCLELHGLAGCHQPKEMLTSVLSHPALEE